MSTAIAINEQQVMLKTYEGKAVVTFSDIDAVHQRPEGTARKRFNDNKKRFVLGEDYFVRKTDEAKTEYGITAPNGLVLITESGYLMLCKSFTDDLSWEVQRKLVDCYFHHKEEQAPYEYFEKTYSGVPVMTTRDFEHFTGVPKSSVNPFLRNHGELGKHYFKVTSYQERLQLKKENPRMRQVCGPLNLINRTGVELLCEAFGIPFDPPEGMVAVQSVLPVPVNNNDKGYSVSAKPCHMVLDIPGNRECNRLVTEAKNYATTVLTMLERYLVYRTKDDAACLQKSLTFIGGDLYSKLLELQNVNCKLIEMPR